MKFLVDMNVSPSWVGFLIEAGFDAVHWSNIGRADATDGEVMRWAAAHDYIVLTCDLDFGAILAASRDRRPSVVQLRSDTLAPDEIGSHALTAIRQCRQALTEGALVSVDAGRMRLRILPLRE